MSPTTELSAKQWIFSMIQSLDHSSFVEMVVTLWAIWYARRRLIHEGEQQSPLSTFLFVRSFLDDLAMASPPARQRTPTRPRQAGRWIAPPLGSAKFNVDAATSKSGPGEPLQLSVAATRGCFWEPPLSLFRTRTTLRCSKLWCAERRWHSRRI